MKQLIDFTFCGKHLVFGLDNVALLFIQIIGSSNHKGDEEEDYQIVKLAKGDDAKVAIHSVAITKISEGSKRDEYIHCAVGRSDKSLSMYQFRLGTVCNSKDVTIQPCRVLTSNKRVSSMVYTSIEENLGDMRLAGTSEYCLLCADHAGDVVAYPLPPIHVEGEEESKSFTSNEHVSKLLLGHTASILTKIKIVRCGGSRKLLSSDRDEKIRISSFPNAFILEGYLLGHSEFISSLDSTDVSNDRTICVSGSGDGTVRLWDYSTCKQIAIIEPSCNDDNHNPSLNDSLCVASVAINTDCSHVAVIREGSSKLEVYRISEDNSKLNKELAVECASNPLTCIFLHGNILCVLMKDPSYIAFYDVNDKSKCISSKTRLTKLIIDAATEESLSLNSLLESSSDIRSNHEKNPLEKHKGIHDYGRNKNSVSASERKRLAKAASSRRKRRNRN